jgi:hypothetical protein
MIPIVSVTLTKTDLLMNCIYTIVKKTVIGMAEMQDTNSKIIYKLVAISQ